MRLFFTYGLFPVWFSSSLVVAYLAHERGVGPSEVIAAITVVTAMVVAVIERVHPAHQSWLRSHDDVGTDAIHVVVSQAAIPALVAGGIHALTLQITGAVPGATEGGLWPHEWPVVAQVGLALVATQFPEYWWHRLSHTHPLLWRLHATHHSAERLYFLNAGRFHPLDTAFSSAIALGTLALLGAGEQAMLLVGVWVAVHGLFQHCNIHLRLGPLNWIFSMAELHRWHHSLEIDEANSNYGNNILFWDIVFGTVYWPRDREASEAIGISSIREFPRGYLGQLLSPIRWDELEEDSGEEASQGSSSPAPPP